MTDASRRAEVLRVLDRYLVEVVERYELCPWARAAREGGELAIEIVWGAPRLEAWLAAAEALLARPTTRVAMVVAPELAITPAELRALRDRVAARLPGAGIAEFHPEAPLELASPARLVPFLRRAPDPLLQLVPLSLLDSVRAAPPVADRARQAQLLGGLDVTPARDVVARIAAANHRTVSAAHAAITATLDDIARDRRDSYARVGISRNPGP
ncbi:MAG: hypothetical protein GX539_14980 [Candidatus Cloacimonetes bacterium]|nr:hypothetical protein [Candidatus Cloacimonadota bacterium]